MISINRADEKLSVIGNIREIRRSRGVASLYKGLGTTLFGILPYAGLKFFFFEYLRNRLNSSSKPKSFSTLENLVCGGMASCLAASFTYPTDVMRRKRQAQVIMSETRGLSYLGLVKNTYEKEGVRGFYKGLGATYLKVMPSSALAFAINEALKKSIHKYSAQK
jgi:hypothetical protein